MMIQQTVLHTERLFLRPVHWIDLEDVHALHSAPETNRYNTLGIPKDINETRYVIQQFIKDYHKVPLRDFTFSIQDKEKETFIGLIALYRDNPKYKGAMLWYKILPRYWGGGYATEAVMEVLSFGFDSLKLHRIGASCAVENQASLRVIEKVGMVSEGVKRKHLPLDSGWSDSKEFAILSEEFNTYQKDKGETVVQKKTN